MSRAEPSPEDEIRRFNEVLAHNSRVLASEGLLQKAVKSILRDGVLDFVSDSEAEAYLVQSRPIIYRSQWDFANPWDSRENIYTISLFHGGPEERLFPSVVGKVMTSPTASAEVESLAPIERNGFDEAELMTVHGLAVAMIGLRTQGELPHLVPALTQLDFSYPPDRY